MNLLDLLKVVMMNSNKKLRRHQEQEFNARLQMEKNAQKEISARLQSLELLVESQARDRQTMHNHQARARKRRK